MRYLGWTCPRKTPDQSKIGARLLDCVTNENVTPSLFWTTAQGGRLWVYETLKPCYKKLVKTSNQDTHFSNP